MYKQPNILILLLTGMNSVAIASEFYVAPNGNDKPKTRVVRTRRRTRRPTVPGSGRRG